MRSTRIGILKVWLWRRRKAQTSKEVLSRPSAISGSGRRVVGVDGCADSLEYMLGQIPREALQVGGRWNKDVVVVTDGGRDRLIPVLLTQDRIFKGFEPYGAWALSARHLPTLATAVTLESLPLSCKS